MAAPGSDRSVAVTNAPEVAWVLMDPGGNMYLLSESPECVPDGWAFAPATNLRELAD